MKLLVKWSPDWADETDFPGFEVMTEKQWNQYQEEIKNTDPEDLCWSFGTNQWNDYETAEEFLSEFSTQEITEEEEKVLRKFFGGCEDINFGSSKPEGY